MLDTYHLKSTKTLGQNITYLLKNYKNSRVSSLVNLMKIDPTELQGSNYLSLKLKIKGR